MVQLLHTLRGVLQNRKHLCRSRENIINSYIFLQNYALINVVDSSISKSQPHLLIMTTFLLDEETIFYKISSLDEGSCPFIINLKMPTVKCHVQLYFTLCTKFMDVR